MNLASYFLTDLQEITDQEEYSNDHYNMIFKAQDAGKNNRPKKLNSHQIAQRIKEYEQLINQIDTHENPMNVWQEYLDFLLNYLDRSNKKDNEKLFQALELFTRYSIDRDYIKSDIRSARYWIEYSDLCKDKEDVIFHMEENEIGIDSALFYEEICKVYESKMDYQQADKYLLEGKYKSAQLMPLLQKLLKEFESRMESRIKQLKDIAGVQLFHDNIGKSSKKRTRKDFEISQNLFVPHDKNYCNNSHYNNLNINSYQSPTSRNFPQNNYRQNKQQIQQYHEQQQFKKFGNGCYQKKQQRKRLPEKCYIGDGINIYVDEEYRKEVFPNSTILVNDYLNTVEQVKEYIQSKGNNNHNLQSSNLMNKQNNYYPSQQQHFVQQNKSIMSMDQQSANNKQQLYQALNEDLFYPKKSIFDHDLNLSWITREEKKYRSFEIAESQKNSQQVVQFNMCDLFMQSNSRPPSLTLSQTNNINNNNNNQIQGQNQNINQGQGQCQINKNYLQMYQQKLAQPDMGLFQQQDYCQKEQQIQQQQQQINNNSFKSPTIGYNKYKGDQEIIECNSIYTSESPNNEKINKYNRQRNIMKRKKSSKRKSDDYFDDENINNLDLKQDNHINYSSGFQQDNYNNINNNSQRMDSYYEEDINVTPKNKKQNICFDEKLQQQSYNQFQSNVQRFSLNQSKSKRKYSITNNANNNIKNSIPKLYYTENQNDCSRQSGKLSQYLSPQQQTYQQQQQYQQQNKITQNNKNKEDSNDIFYFDQSNNKNIFSQQDRKNRQSILNSSKMDIMNNNNKDEINSNEKENIYTNPIDLLNHSYISKSKESQVNSKEYSNNQKNNNNNNNNYDESISDNLFNFNDYSNRQNKRSSSKSSKHNNYIKSIQGSSYKKSRKYKQNHNNLNDEDEFLEEQKYSPMSSEKQYYPQETEQLRSVHQPLSQDIFQSNNLNNLSFQSNQFYQELQQMNKPYQSEIIFSPNSIDDNFFKIPQSQQKQQQLRRNKKNKQQNIIDKNDNNIVVDDEEKENQNINQEGSITDQEDEEISNILNLYCFNSNKNKNKNKNNHINNNNNNIDEYDQDLDENEDSNELDEMQNNSEQMEFLSDNNIEDIQNKENQNLYINQRRSKSQSQLPRKPLQNLPIEEFIEDDILLLHNQGFHLSQLGSMIGGGGSDHINHSLYSNQLNRNNNNNRPSHLSYRDQSNIMNNRTNNQNNNNNNHNNQDDDIHVLNNNFNNIFLSHSIYNDDNNDNDNIIFHHN